MVKVFKNRELMENEREKRKRKENLLQFCLNLTFKTFQHFELKIYFVACRRMHISRKEGLLF